MIKIGIIGMSPGNAHPYSWSAIVNGFFDGDEITNIGYPGITNYLTANQDTLGIAGAQVTHVWTQNRAISESIVKAARVNHIADNSEDMIGQVDAVILSRDDAEGHVKMAAPFLDADVPIFIDKPLATSYEDLAYFSEQHAQGKFIMSCSSMRFASECRALKTDINSLGKIELVTAVGKKDWLKYGIHMLEALFALLDDPQPVLVQHVGEDKKDVVYLEFENGIKVTVHLFMDIALTFQISVFGQKGWELVEIKNSYSMFRDNLIEFIRSVQEGKPRLSFDKTERLMRTLIGARESLINGGKIIRL
jgi:predicted dehydrogenase